VRRAGAVEPMDLPREASRVRIGPADEVSPALARIPLAQCLRWWSPHEGPGREPYLAVFMTGRAFVRCCAHAGSDLENVVGAYRRDRATGRPFIVVEAALPARHTRQGRTHLTFTHDSLVELHEELEARYPTRRLVGWYHTHPGMDVFLSGYDLWLHEHFFPFSWQVALVIEPQSRRGGFFVRGPDGQPHPRHYTGFGELVRPSTALTTGLPSSAADEHSAQDEEGLSPLPADPPTTFPEAPSFREGRGAPRSVVNWDNLRLDGVGPLTDRGLAKER